MSEWPSFEKHMPYQKAYEIATPVTCGTDLSIRRDQYSRTLQEMAESHEGFGWHHNRLLDAFSARRAYVVGGTVRSNSDHSLATAIAAFGMTFRNYTMDIQSQKIADACSAAIDALGGEGRYV